MQFVLIVHNRTPNCFRATALRRRDGRVLPGHQRPRRRRAAPMDQPADVFCRRTPPPLQIFKTPVSVNGIPMPLKRLNYLQELMKNGSY